MWDVSQYGAVDPASVPREQGSSEVLLHVLQQWASAGGYTDGVQDGESAWQLRCVGVSDESEETTVTEEKLDEHTLWFNVEATQQDRMEHLKGWHRAKLVGGYFVAQLVAIHDEAHRLEEQ